MRKLWQFAGNGLMAAAVLTLAGCGGEKMLSVKGKVEENKAALKKPEGLPPGTPGVRVCFYRLSDGDIGEPLYATIDDDGNFQVSGPNGKGISAGTYRISVEAPKPGTQAKGPGPGVGGGARPGGPPGIGPGTGPGASSDGVFGMQDRFNGAFSKTKSQLNIEITEDTQLVIDVGGKGKVTTVD